MLPEAGGTTHRVGFELSDLFVRQSPSEGLCVLRIDLMRRWYGTCETASIVAIRGGRGKPRRFRGRETTVSQSVCLSPKPRPLAKSLVRAC